ncbi:MAG: endolytic transglycosylase MltG [Candidatus Pacebacteria bacterium]|nr:endolytic transglycosylase MltG [Candidatus Paceibacterota bacterium]
MENNIDEIILKKTKINKINILLVFILLIVFLYSFLTAHNSNKEVIIHVGVGQSVDSLSQELRDINVVKNDFLFKLYIKLLKSGPGIISGDYLIKENTPVWKIALQVGRGRHGIEPVKVTIREGLTNEEIANLLSVKLINFNKDIFLTNTLDKQGYLFPDTYFLYPLDDADEIIKKLSNNFQNRIKKIETSINSSGKTLSEIVIMASILEGEASGKEDIVIISGILWKRISFGMALQVDVDQSTYNIRGLPQKPLNNPGLMSISAAINPVKSDYLYYIHDKNGNVHYARNFDEHKRNISKYLK